jgi:pyruvate-formate lyase-activating enzyme
MKQTAVEWLMDKLPHSIETQFEKYIKQAKKMEKEQRKKDFVNGYKKKAEMSNSTFDEISEYAATEYYNETFKQQTP